MLKKFLYIILCVSLANTSFARSNADIGRQLYSIANEVLRVNPVRGEEMKSDIASFLIDINMLKFDENKAVWRKLPSGWYYDTASVQHLYLRHIGVYKSPNASVMGVFDVNCEDYNDMQERFFGYVNKTEVYFSATSPLKGRSLGLMQTFCKR